MRPSCVLPAVLLAFFCACSKSAPEGAKAAPESRLQLLQAEKPELSGFGELRGQAVVLEFWATWCEPCVEEIPRLAALAKKFEGRPVRFISISDEPKGTVSEFLKTHVLPGWVAYDGGEAFRAFGVRGRPQTVLLDPQGRVAAKTYPSEVDERVLESLLAGRPLGLRGREDDAPAAAPKESEALLSLRIARADPAGKMSMRLGGASFEMRTLPLRTILPKIYGLPDERLVLPADLSAGSYDVLAEAPRGTDVLGLLRPAVEAAFGLRSRREKRTLDVWVLRSKTGRPGPGMRVSESTHSGGYSLMEGDVSVQGHTMAEAAGVLEETLGRPMFDETRLPGRYSFDLKWTKGDEGSLRRALLEGLGIEPVSVRRPVEVVVVERSAPGNAPGTPGGKR